MALLGYSSHQPETKTLIPLASALHPPPAQTQAPCLCGPATRHLQPGSWGGHTHVIPRARGGSHAAITYGRKLCLLPSASSLFLSLPPHSSPALASLHPSCFLSTFLYCSLALFSLFLHLLFSLLSSVLRFSPLPMLALLTVSLVSIAAASSLFPPPALPPLWPV